jgi:hypothetical protein
MSKWRPLDLGDRIAHNKSVGSTWFNERMSAAEQEAAKLLGDDLNETQGDRIKDFRNALDAPLEERAKSAKEPHDKADYNGVLVRLRERTK